MHEANLAAGMLELLQPLEAVYEMHVLRLMDAGWTRSHAETIGRDVFDILRATAIRAIEITDAAIISESLRDTSFIWWAVWMPSANSRLAQTTGAVRLSTTAPAPRMHRAP
ncbi:hypothetical protein E3T61_03050 [Cryobacterium lactosi]|uniref:Uncharacterized protein n=1 Tax=Cryobacterium lactosi TaxID=1259202 RepID=A0A4R9BZ11_9MICO|nr:hypothetical protein [Cryobacterium lactosi]TFD93992.1 hypothetical protein E3T61_03050 [Cryobacterium lactosi]